MVVPEVKIPQQQPSNSQPEDGSGLMDLSAEAPGIWALTSTLLLDVSCPVDLKVGRQLFHTLYTGAGIWGLNILTDAVKSEEDSGP